MFVPTGVVDLYAAGCKWKRREHVDPEDYPEALGERLRHIRQQQGLSLQDVEAASGEEIKASVLGAYERGERSVSVARLRVLADFYRVPIEQLLPDAEHPRSPRAAQGMRIDLTRLESLGPDQEIVTRYLASIQARRNDYNNRVLTIRGEDVETLAVVLSESEEDVRRRLALAGSSA